MRDNWLDPDQSEPETFRNNNLLPGKQRFTIQYNKKWKNELISGHTDGQKGISTHLNSPTS